MPQTAENLKSAPLIEPWDEHNQRTAANVHPLDWKNPEPAERYNLVVVVAGTAGLISAIGSAGLGAKAALVEKHLMGGDCLNVGCVPLQGSIRASRVAHDARNAAEFGVRLEGKVSVDFPMVMERMRRLRADISKNDSASPVYGKRRRRFHRFRSIHGPRLARSRGQDAEVLQSGHRHRSARRRAPAARTRGNGIPDERNRFLADRTPETSPRHRRRGRSAASYRRPSPASAPRSLSSKRPARYSSARTRTLRKSSKKPSSVTE